MHEFELVPGRDEPTATGIAYGAVTIVFLKTRRLDLRPLEVADAEGPYVGWFNDPEVCRFNAHFVFPYRTVDALAYIEAANASSSELVLALIERASKAHIGNIALSHIDPVHRAAEFTIVLGDRDSWGKGFSREAGAALLHHAFRVLNLNRVACGTPAENEPMRRLALGLGMTEEGVRRSALFKDGRYLDMVEYGILEAEYTDPRS